MERLKERIALASKALETLKELVPKKQPSKTERDAAIQRFEYTFEACWKAAQRYLQIHEGMTIGSPKGCVRASREVGLLSKVETVLGLDMADARNLTVHTYNESLAEKLHKKLPGYTKLLEHWIFAMQQRIHK